MFFLLSSRNRLDSNDVNDKVSIGGGVEFMLLPNMASWKCALYGVVATLIIVLIILLNFDFLPERKLSEELELAKKSGHKRPVTPTGITTLRTSTSTVEKVRRLKLIFHVCCGFLEQFIECFLVKIGNVFPVLIIANLVNKF